jgi:hypothetical protein
MKFGFAACAALVAFATTGVVSAAPFALPQKTLSTTLGYQSTSYTIPVGGKQTEIMMPVANRPIHIMVTSVATSNAGMASGTIYRAANDGNNYLMWLADDIASNESSTASISQGATATQGTHIMYADYMGWVDVQVQNDSHIQILNNGTHTATVVVTLMY